MDRSNYRVPDPHAPRFIKKRFDILNNSNKDFYSAMKKKHPELKKYKNKEIANYIELFNKRIGKEIIDNRNGVRLTDGLGIIVTGACKLSNNASRKNIDYGTSNTIGQQLLHQNLHTDQYVFKIKYSSVLDKHMFINHHMWCFESIRWLKRAVSAEFKKEGGYKKYIVFTTKQHIAHLFRNQRIVKTSKLEVMRERSLEGYDEFAF